MDVARTPKSRVSRHWLLAAGSTLAVALTVLLVLGVEPAAPTVDQRTLLVDSARRGSFAVTVRGPGTLVPEQIRWITALTAGRVEQRFLDPGEAVEADTVILQLDNPDVELKALDAKRQLTAARGELLALQTQLEEQRLGLVATIASMKADYGSAVREADAAKGLVAKKILSSIEADRKREEAEEMDERYRVEKQRLVLLETTSEGKVALQAEEVESLEKIAAFHAERVESMTVRPGASGVLQDTNLEIGQWVQPGEVLAKVAESQGLKALLRIPETLARDVALGQPARIDTRNGVISGKVFRIDPSVRNGSVEVQVRLLGDLPRGARSDLSVDGTIETARSEDALFIARPAFSQADSEMALFKLESSGGSATRVGVRIGRVASDAAEVLAGLAEGDQVIVSDMSRWSDFDRVELD
jgi:HlyD family secretion protein